MLKVILRLRRDNDYNYAKVKDTFIPANGEICLVDTAREGLRAVCGDGVTPFAQLEYMDNYLIKGYYSNNKFFKDLGLTDMLSGNPIKVYIDIPTSIMYHYDGQNYVEITSRLPAASSTAAGAVKLYGETGQHTDGTMTQKAITDELNTKVSLEISEEDSETLVFKF